MPEFILNTDGAESTFAALDAFTRGYIEAAFFTETNDLYDSDEWDSEQAQSDIAEGVCGGNIPGDSSFSDIAPESLVEIVADCAAWQAKNAELLAAAYELDYSAEQAGRDYWFTRNGHGVGFWDRDVLAEPFSSDGRYTLGYLLGESARRACNVDMYRGDDSQIYFS